jgi:hypothetical protein
LYSPSNPENTQALIVTPPTLEVSQGANQSQAQKITLIPVASTTAMEINLFPTLEITLTPTSSTDQWTAEFTPSLPVDALRNATQAQIVTTLFDLYLNHYKFLDADTRYRLDEYEIYNVEFTSPDLEEMAKKHGADFAAGVFFSVRPTVLMYSHWLAGNGTPTDIGWVEGKYLIVAVDKDNGVYMLQIIGTG